MFGEKCRDVEFRIASPADRDEAFVVVVYPPHIHVVDAYIAGDESCRNKRRENMCAEISKHASDLGIVREPRPLCDIGEAEVPSFDDLHGYALNRTEEFFVILLHALYFHKVITGIIRGEYSRYNEKRKQFLYVEVGRIERHLAPLDDPFNLLNFPVPTHEWFFDRNAAKAALHKFFNDGEVIGGKDDSY